MCVEKEEVRDVMSDASRVKGDSVYPGIGCDDESVGIRSVRVYAGERRMKITHHSCARGPSRAFSRSVDRDALDIMGVEDV